MHWSRHTKNLSFYFHLWINQCSQTSLDFYFPFSHLCMCFAYLMWQLQTNVQSARMYNTYDYNFFWEHKLMPRFNASLAHWRINVDFWYRYGLLFLIGYCIISYGYFIVIILFIVCYCNFLSYHRKYGRVQTRPVHRGSSAGTHAVAAKKNQGEELAEHWLKLRL